MKNLIVITSILLFSISSFSQSWKYLAGGNTFDGKYKTASVQGKGNEYPYTAPFLVVNKFDEGGINFYLNSVGYFSSSAELTIKFVFDENREEMYQAYDVSISDDGKIIFLEDFSKEDKIYSTIEILGLIMKSSKLEIRVSYNYGKNDLKFSLAGSTKALSFVFPNKQIEKKNQAVEQARIKEKAELLSMKLKKDKYFNNLFSKYTLRQVDKFEISNMIIGGAKTIETNFFELDSINIVKTSSTETHTSYKIFLYKNGVFQFKVSYVLFESFIIKEND